ncbi:hypothetical protein [Bacillus sp. FJAT-28004]|uniref:hypothetical protein n=1 Tax=Bacillus sp. FJAT-28004 TaxID=1679165 RepID=UPI000AD0DC14|nr:hypothetical protein [Bacillus sp. FJAT-28004]
MRARMMANEQELREIKESLDKLEKKVNQLVERPRRKRSGLVNFVIGFLIVFVAMCISAGIIEIVKNIYIQ